MSASSSSFIPAPLAHADNQARYLPKILITSVPFKLADTGHPGSRRIVRYDPTHDEKNVTEENEKVYKIHGLTYATASNSSRFIA
ncbi:hypothetical protein TNCV_3263121 [Trichonephila clavipes]|nr:hypothetical protein TNCV_3263121 [Trichonephila clavipes]